MPAVPHPLLPVRRLDAGRDLELFLVVAVTTVLAVRAALAAAGWPQLSGDTLHIAHITWGVLGMLIAVVIFAALDGRLWRTLALVSAGIGFGLLIDSLGKFITVDNDYFFQPVIALIYLVFVGLFLVARVLGSLGRPSPRAALVNALELAKDATAGGPDPDLADEAVRLLARAGDDPLAAELARVLRTARDEARDPGSARSRASLHRRSRALVARLAGWRFLRLVVVGWFVVAAVVDLASLFRGRAAVDEPDFWSAGLLLSTAAVGALVVAALLSWRRSRLAGLRWLQRALLVALFAHQFFVFYRDELAAVGGLALVLVAYALVRAMVAEEERREGAEVVGAADDGRAGNRPNAPLVSQT